MRLDDAPKLAPPRYPVILISRHPRFAWHRDDEVGPASTMHDDTWQLSARQFRYRPDDWLHLASIDELPYDAPGWIFEVEQHGPDPTCNGRVRQFLSDARLDTLNRESTWVLMPNIGPLYGHIEIHGGMGLRGTWVLRYPTINEGRSTLLQPEYLAWRHPREPWI